MSSVGQALHRCASSFEVELYYVPPKDEFSTPGGGGDQWGQGSIEAGNPSGAGSYGLSPFTSFAYYAEDGITSERSDEDAQVVLFVAPCNDPPVSRNTSAAALSHTLWPVSVNATDVDDDESFTQVTRGEEITRQVAWSVFYRILFSYRADFYLFLVTSILLSHRSNSSVLFYTLTRPAYFISQCS